ncbi:MAG: DUF1993 family protein, partial [Pseudomonadota bacterium]
MSVSFHQLSLPVLVRALRNTVAVIDKTAAWAAEKQASTPPSLSVEQGIVQSRLAPDMFPFARQVQIAADVAKACAARLSGIEPPKYDDNEASLAELRARLEKTIAFIEGVDRLAVEAASGGTVTFKTGGRDLTMKSVDYVNHYVFPNVYFGYRKFNRPFLAVCWAAGGRARTLYGAVRGAGGGFGGRQGRRGALSPAFSRPSPPRGRTQP